MRQISVLEWTNGNQLALEPKSGQMEEILISPNRQKKIYTLNRFGHCSSNWYQTGLDAIYQLAQRFTAPQEGMQLTAIELCKDPSASVFRIRIYDVASDYQYPSKDLIDTVIEVRSEEGHVRIDLEEFDIVIPGKGFFVAIEWLFIPFNEQREKIKLNGRITYSSYYKPAIRYINNQDKEKENTWRLGFNGRWSEMSYSSKRYNFQITVKLR
jgi:hypothetical protein